MNESEIQQAEENDRQDWLADGAARALADIESEPRTRNGVRQANGEEELELASGSRLGKC
jgi:hypothetical protein